MELFLKQRGNKRELYGPVFINKSSSSRERERERERESKNDVICFSSDHIHASPLEGLVHSDALNTVRT